MCAHKATLLKNSERNRQRYADDEDYRNRVKQSNHNYAVSEKGKKSFAII